jgi:osmotically-inducible protein OsmY
MVIRNVILTAMLAAAATAYAETAPVSDLALAQIAADTQHQIATLPHSDVFDSISFRLEGYTVVLTGQVTKTTLKTEAEKAVRAIEGVQNVDNQIEVLPATSSDERLRTALYRAIYDFASLQHYTASRSIRIMVKNGDVSLEGVVDSQIDRMTVKLRAEGVNGARSVTDNLCVESKSR